MTLNLLTGTELLGRIGHWWTERGLEAPPGWLLPEAGYVVRDEAGAVAVAWLAVTEGVPVGRVEWMATRPGLSVRAAREAGRMILWAMEAECRRRGLRVLFAASCLPGMVREVEGCGFTATVHGVVHLVKAIS
jgi:hypothetical protein